MADKKKSVVERIIDDVINDIIAGKLAPGDQIPTEMELCRNYGAGRNSVREAIKQLQAYGVVYIKRADGTFVSEEYNHRMLDPMLYSIILKKNSWRDFVELRSVIDIGTLHVLINKSGTDELFPRLHQLLNKMEDEIHKSDPSVESIMDTDMRFHEMMAMGTGNPQLITITEYITRLTMPSRINTVREVIINGDEDNFIRLHRQWLSVLENHEVDKIDQTVTDHYVYWK